MRIFVLSLVLILLMAVGCGKFKREDIIPVLPETITEATDTVIAIDTNAKDALKNLESAKEDASLIENEVIQNSVLPKLDTSIKDVIAISVAVPKLAGAVVKLEKVEKELASAAENLEKLTSSTTAGIKRYLIWIGVLSFLGVAGSIPLFIWVTQKGGIAVGAASLLTFILSTAFYKYFEYFIYVGLGIIGVVIAGLVITIIINRKALKELIIGAQSVKDTLEEIMSKMKPEELMDFFKKCSTEVQSKFRSFVNSILQEEQSSTTAKLVDEIKEKVDL